MKKKLAVMTFVYNEKKQLPRWLSHYANQVDSLSDLYVIDHGSDDGSVENLPTGVNVINLTRDDGYGNYEKWRVGFAAALCKNLQNEYDAVIYIDCDEYLVVDPFVAQSLNEYFSNKKGVSTHAIGFDVLHDFKNEPNLLENKISKVRRNIQFVAAMCKPCVVLNGYNINWGQGFHVSNIEPKFGDLYLFHARYADFDESKQRLKLTRTLFMPELDKCAVNHQKIDDSMLENWLSSWLAFNKSDDDITSKIGGINKYIESFKFNLSSDGIYYYDYSFRSTLVYSIPGRFNGIF